MSLWKAGHVDVINNKKTIEIELVEETYRFLNQSCLQCSYTIKYFAFSTVYVTSIHMLCTFLQINN